MHKGRAGKTYYLPCEIDCHIEFGLESLELAQMWKGVSSQGPCLFSMILQAAPLQQQCLHDVIREVW